MEQAALAQTDFPQEEMIAPAGFPAAWQIAALRGSYQRIEPASELVATLFFRRLNEIAPEVLALLPTSAEEQHSQLRSSLALAIASLDRFADITPALKLLGSRFRSLGVTEFHYGAVGEALLWTLQNSLGSHWTSETADAWTAFCTEIAEIMTASRP